MAQQPPKFTVEEEDGADSCKIYLQLEGVEQARSPFIEYNIESSGIINMYHTFSPPEFRGQGMAAQVCDAAFHYAKERQWKVRPSCSYIRDRFLVRNPHWLEIVAED